MKRRKLPLDSNNKNWGPLNDAYAAAFARSGAHALALTDVQRRLENESIRSMMCRLAGSPPHAKPVPELLSGRSWREDYEIYWDGEAHIGVRPRTEAIALDPNRSAFFVWKPDLAKVFPSGEPASNCQQLPINTPPGAQEKRGRHKQFSWDKIKSEIIRQIAANLPTWPKSSEKIADDVRDWCKKNDLKPPANSTLREKVSEAIELLRRWF
jgi:hypothetical protein